MTCLARAAASPMCTCNIVIALALARYVELHYVILNTQFIFIYGDWMQGRVGRGSHHAPDDPAAALRSGSVKCR